MSINVGGVEFSDDAIAALKSGEQVSGVINSDGELQTASAIKPAVHVPITGYGKQVRPTVKDAAGEPANKPGSLVTAPDMARLNSTHDAEMARLQLERAEQEEALSEQKRRLNPLALLEELDDSRKRIAFLERSVKRLTKTVTELKKQP